MVQDSRKALCADTFKPVNMPEPVQVEEDNSGLPVAVRMARKQAVASIEDSWRIDDEWWRSAPLSRVYYTLMLASGQRLELYKDLINQRWYRQAY